MATFVQNMAVTHQVLVQRLGTWADVYDHRTELRAGLEEIVRVVVYNRTSQRAAYNLKPEDNGNARKDQVRVGMATLDAGTGQITGMIKPIDSGWVDIPGGGSIDVSIAPMEAAILEFCYTWADPTPGATPPVSEPRFNRGAFGGGVYHLLTSKEASPSITAPGWTP